MRAVWGFLHLGVTNIRDSRAYQPKPSNQYSLDFIEADLIVASVIEAGGAGALVVRHLLRHLDLSGVT